MYSYWNLPFPPPKIKISVHFTQFTYPEAAWGLPIEWRKSLWKSLRFWSKSSRNMFIQNFSSCMLVVTGCWHPPPLLFGAAKAGRIHVNELITPLLPTGINERYSPTISGADENSPYKRKCWTNSVGPLYQSLLWDACSECKLTKPRCLWPMEKKETTLISPS